MAQLKLGSSAVTKDGVGEVVLVLKSGYVIKTKIGSRYSAMRFYETSEVKKA